MGPAATLVLAERVMPAPPYDAGALPIAMSDLNMLVSPGGQERTASEYEAVLAAGGLRLTRVVPTASDVSLVEARLLL
jgi:hypothetical protein